MAYEWLKKSCAGHSGDRGGAVVLGLMSEPAYAFSYSVTGTINYRDSAGNLHPARDVSLQLLNSSGTSVDATTTTDLKRQLYDEFFVDLRHSDSRKILAFRPRTTAGYVSPDATADNVYAVYPQSFTVGTGVNVINVNMQNTNPNTDYYASPTFSVLDAIETGWQYATDVRGQALIRLPTLFPQNPKDTSFFSPTDVNIHVLLLDRWDWDVVLHEYGHYLQYTDQDSRQSRGLA